ncbi:hypothetical protein CLU96_1241 [Chryseobacterium sp. 52]|uniref:hypothetical protein n=1 Tax=Chryseobacterium sp. 52 TaxID=2035213 RepID=UPI000C180DDB|nr:hypothetical protein [Chryseobacterium sp. 52]PIF44300.1 hypothetical protein CLU96_1241 [Chryseobacterium sp. 52]
MWEKIKRYQENLKKESDPDVSKDIKAVISGMTNFYIHSKSENAKAKARYEKSCAGCAYFISDPIESEKVTDKDIPDLSGKICSLCGCTSSYKLRQTIKPCEFWKE